MRRCSTISRSSSRRGRRSRRGQLNLPFHLILAIVGGALLFIVLLLFAFKILQNAEQERIRSLTFRLENEFRFGATENNLFKELEVPRDGIEVVCTLGPNASVDDAHLRIEKGAYAEDSLLYLPVFSAGQLRGPTLYVWAKRWLAPMSVGTFLFVDDRWTRYVLVTNGRAWVRRLAEKMGAFRVSVITPAELASFDPTGDERYRFILFGGNLLDIPVRFRERASALLIHSENGGESGILSFHDDIASTLPAMKTEYRGEALLLGAIFAADSRIYECNLAKAEGVLYITSAVMREKARLLEEEAIVGAAVDPECELYYARAGRLLEQFGSRGLLNIRVDSPLILELERLNAGMRSKDCPPLY